LPHSNEGLISVRSNHDGYSFSLTWEKAYLDILDYQLAYNIYYSTLREHVFDEGPKFLIYNTLATDILDVSPGETYYFAVRATEFDPLNVNISSLPDSGTSKIYPEGALLSNITELSTSLQVSDLDLFPNYGIIQLGVELIKYVNKDYLTNSLTGLTRGFLNTKIRLHTTDGYDGYHTYDDSLVKFWHGFEELNEVITQATSTFAYSNFPKTFIDGYKSQEIDILTTDLGGVDSSLGAISVTEGGTSAGSQEALPAYDYAGWHRTPATSILRGDCLDTYIGGENFCADGYGVGQTVRGISVNQENARREEILLEATGEPVVLIRRVWTGIRCQCYLLTSENPDDRCPYCFPPGTLVRSEFGWKPIETIEINEKVLTSSGDFQKVTKIFENDYDGVLQSITSSVGTKPILATPEHPFSVLRGKHDKKIGCGPKCDLYITNGDGKFRYKISKLSNSEYILKIYSWKTIIVEKIFSTKKDALNYYKNYKEEYEQLGHQISWDKASNIATGDWLVPQWNNEIIDLEEIEIPQEFKKNTHLGSIRNGTTKFKVDEYFMWIIGIYLAEGFTGKRSINFAFHKNEIDYHNKVLNFFKNLGFNGKIKKSSENGVVVEINSTTLSLWFKNWLGTKCYNKKIPNELMSLPNNKLKNILLGIYDGDGSKRDHEISQTSEILALQLVEILHRLGYQPLTRHQQSKSLTPKGNKRRLAYVVSWENAELKNTNRRGRWDFDKKHLSQVKSSSIVENYKGKVYNLEVEGDHTYVVQGIVVHNCFGGGFITSFDQFFNPRRSDGRILVRFEPTEDDLKFDENGLESTFLPSAWTLVVPSIKDRDILVRFNEDGSEEFRYEVLNVTRNKIFLGESGAQKFRLQRIRKTDSIYQWKAVRNTSTMPQNITTSIAFIEGPNGIPIPHTHSIVVNENIISVNQINGTTSVGAGHNHEVRNGVVMSNGLHPDSTHIFVI
jgi:intein/homing endonuclease